MAIPKSSNNRIVLTKMYGLRFRPPRKNSKKYLRKNLLLRINIKVTTKEWNSVSLIIYPEDGTKTKRNRCTVDETSNFLNALHIAFIQLSIWNLNYGWLWISRWWTCDILRYRSRFNGNNWENQVNQWIGINLATCSLLKWNPYKSTATLKF